MGLWWKNIDATPPKDEDRRVSFSGDHEAVPKRWYPILWRYHQNWHIIRVISDNSYKLFFRSASGCTMQYRKLIYSQYVAVRVGPEDVTFWATSEASGEPLKITDLKTMVPGRYRRDTRNVWEREDARALADRAVFI